MPIPCPPSFARSVLAITVALYRASMVVVLSAMVRDPAFPPVIPVPAVPAPPVLAAVVFASALGSSLRPARRRHARVPPPVPS